MGQPQVYRKAFARSSSAVQFETGPSMLKNMLTVHPVDSNDVFTIPAAGTAVVSYRVHGANDFEAFETVIDLVNGPYTFYINMPVVELKVTPNNLSVGKYIRVFWSGWYE